MATTILTAEGATRRTETTAKATYAPLVVLALAQIGTSSDSAAMNLATASLVGTLGATLDDIQMATTLFSLIAGGLIGVTIGGKIFSKINAATLRRLVYLVMAVSGVKMLF